MQPQTSGAGDIVHLFVDTNAFIQLRDLKDLPWRELFPKAKRIDILVSQTVIDELDHLKAGTNDRKRNRARLALNVINEASNQSDFALALPHTAIGLRIVIATGPLPDWFGLPRLDRNRPGDRLVAEVIAFGRDAELLSHDSGPLIRARINGVRAYEPPESWQLPVEQTDDKRRIGQLERDLTRALNTFPAIVASFGSLDSPKERFEFIAPVLPSLTAEQQHKLVASYLDRHPRKFMKEQLDGSGFELALRPVSGDTAQSYNNKLRDFEENVALYFSKLPQTIFLMRRAVSIEFAIRNDSGVAAQSLHIDLRADGGARLLLNEEDAASTVGSGKPPALPKFVHRHDAFDRIREANELSLELSRLRDPTNFYWVATPKGGAEENALLCADFRATRPWESDIWLRPKSKEPFTVTMAISATNLAAPVIRTASVSLEAKQLDWADPLVREFLPDAIRPDFDAVL